MSETETTARDGPLPPVLRVLKAVFAGLFRLFWGVEVNGLENFRAAGDRAVLVVNHTSYLDAPLLALFLPGRPIFAINTHVAQYWWVRPFLRLVRAFRVDPANPFAMKALIAELRAGGHAVIFPEGRITTTGSLMKIYEGPGMVADRAGAAVLPVRIDGAQFTPFSLLRGKVRLRWFPKITVTILEPHPFPLPEGLCGRRRRQAIGDQLYDLMSEMIFRTSACGRTLFAALLDARAVHGGRTPVLEDTERTPIGYDRLVLGSFVLGQRIARMTKRGEITGVLLPNATGVAVTFFALQAYGRVAAMLNFTAGAAGLLAACRMAGIATVLTSRRFIERAHLEAEAAALDEAVNLVYLEDLRAQLGLKDKLSGLLARAFARTAHRRARRRSDDPAVVLFTSGSEGMPKGVVLSHASILANCRQLAARVDFNPTDVVFNPLPVFHSFGLTGGLILPLLSGVRTFLYPSPLHYRIVPEMVYSTNATIMFGIDTFLAGYAKMAHPYDFYAMRYIFAGAEKVRDETRRIWAEKFGLRIFEGYGATETSPVLAVNTPMHYRAGTVGRLLPGIQCRLEPVPGIEPGGRLQVRGPNVMLGYLRPEHLGAIEPLPDGWYDTGDIVDIDADGFVRIVGRVRRFAKVAGEMISLAAVEALAHAVWPEHRHAVVALPDERKGEQLVLVTDKPDAARDPLLAEARNRGYPELAVPRTILTAETLPVMGSGKVDLVKVRAQAAERVGQRTAA